MYDTFGGRVDDLKTWLIEERFPQGWQPRVTKRYGYTMLSLNLRSLQVCLPFNVVWDREKLIHSISWLCGLSHHRLSFLPRGPSAMGSTPLKRLVVLQTLERSSSSRMKVS